MQSDMKTMKYGCNESRNMKVLMRYGKGGGIT